MKEISKEKLKANNEEKLIQNELNVHPKLNHEHIIKLHNYYEDKSKYYLLLEYASKGSLYNLIKNTNGKGIPEKEAFKIFIQVASAVFFLHDNKLVHRDIKPENILIDENNKLKLCDFGWCVGMSLGNRTSFCGTYEYMAPEMISEIPYNFCVDIWALGVLLFELLHGYSPFRSNSSAEDYYLEVFRNVSKHNFKIEREISENCADLLKKLLDKNHTDRIKIKDVFQHPWVIENENKETNHKQRNSESTNFQSNSSQNSNANNKSKDVEVIPSLNHMESSVSNNIIEDPNTLFDKVLDKLSQKTKKGKKKESSHRLAFVPTSTAKSAKNVVFDEPKTSNKTLQMQYTTINFNLDLSKSCSFSKVKENYYNDKNYQQEFDKEFMKLKERTRTKAQKSIKLQSIDKNELKGDQYATTNIHYKCSDRLEEIFNEKDEENARAASTAEIISAVEILGRVENNMNVIEKKEEEKKKGFWDGVVSFINPFKCG